MRNISRRIEKVENKMSITQKMIIVIISSFQDKEGIEIPTEASDWLIYPEAVRAAINGTVVLQECEEIAARRKQLKATKNN